MPNASPEGIPAGPHLRSVDSLPPEIVAMLATTQAMEADAKHAASVVVDTIGQVAQARIDKQEDSKGIPLVTAAFLGLTAFGLVKLAKKAWGK